MIFSDTDNRDMLTAAYTIEQLAWGFEIMPLAPSREALTEMYGDLCPNGPPPPDPDWKSFGRDCEYAAGYDVQMHLRYGREGVEAYYAHFEQMEREMDEEDRR